MDNYKEYLDPADGYALVKQSVNMPVHPHWIGVPDGAELYVYWRENDTYNFQVDKSYFENGSWQPCAWTVEEIKSDKAGAKILWSRKPKEDPALISGADALRALADGKEVEFKDGTEKWENIKYHMNLDLSMFLTSPEWMMFRLKPTTLKVNAELPKPSREFQQNTEVYAVTYEFKTRDERNAFADKLRGNNS